MRSKFTAEGKAMVGLGILVLIPVTAALVLMYRFSPDILAIWLAITVVGVLIEVVLKSGK